MTSGRKNEKGDLRKLGNSSAVTQKERPLQTSDGIHGETAPHFGLTGGFEVKG